MTPVDDQDIRQLLAEVGPLVRAEMVSEWTDGFWVVSLDDELPVLIEQDEDRGVLVISAEIGQAPQGSEAMAYRQLLEFSTWWRETGGMRMGLDPLDQTVLASAEVAQSGLDAHVLAGRILAFAQQILAAKASLLSVGQPPRALAAADAFLRA